MSSCPPFLLLGNPENRRVTLFVEALKEQRQPEPTILAHRELLAAPERLAEIPDQPHIVRLDSYGENAEVERALLALGYEDAAEAGVGCISPDDLAARPVRHGEILCPRQLHFGFLRYLKSLHELFMQRPNWRILAPPRSVAELFDKRLTSRRYFEAGIPVPTALPPVDSPDSLRQEMRTRGWKQAVVKLTSGSSASCLAVFRHDRVGADGLMTTMQRADDGWFNSLKVQRVDDPARIDEVLAFLLREGSIVERLVPKARIEGAYFDLRILVVDGEASFIVVRQNSHPITNLHLGGWRGEVEKLRALVPSPTLARVNDSCRRVWKQHDCFQVAVDVLIESDRSKHRVVEANAFGDLLPGLSRGGLSVYGWQIRRALRLND